MNKRIKVILFCGLATCLFSCNQMGRNGAKSLTKKIGKETVEKVSEGLGKKAAKELSKEASEKTLKTTLKQGLMKGAVSIAAVVPTGGGINAEGRTLAKIVAEPLLKKQVDAFKLFCKNNGISNKTCATILADFTRKRGIPSPSVKGHVDLSKAAVIIGKFPEKDELLKILKANNYAINQVNLRKVHYDIALEAFAKKYNVTKSQASQIIGNLFDHVIHEAEDGTIQIVPNNIHRFTKFYKHNGLVAKRMQELTGKVVTEEI
jgi:hypothetical protein